MINPYTNVDWDSVAVVHSCSHEHCNRQSDLINLIGGGLQHIALSNYHPSIPYYPLEDFFTNVPSGILGCPNAEFYSMDIANFHANGLGSFYAEDVEQATPESWKQKFPKILANLQYADGGGITLNHPAWTKSVGRQLRNDDLVSMLDFDDRVLGIEFYNAGSPDNTTNIWDLDTWDYILMKRRRCWGFCVADHDGQRDSDDQSYNTAWRGRNILLCDSSIMNNGTTAEKEHECLKAYREGRFYGSIYNTSLLFSSITFTNYVLSVTAIDADYINVVIDGVYNRINSDSATYNIPPSSTYVRVEAHNGTNSIFSQPIMLKTNNGVLKMKLFALGMI